MLVVLKIGSNLLQTKSGDIDLSFISRIAEQIKQLQEEGYKFIVVSSGAVLAGIKKLGLNRKPKTLIEKQALASVGQAYLMHLYDTVFSNYGIKVSQVLLNADVFKNRERYETAKNTFHQLLKWNILPIVNENDAIAVEELIFGDNDFLAAHLAVMLNPNFVIVMSTAGGIYTGDPREAGSKLIKELSNPEEAFQYVRLTKSDYGSGGMKSKLEAAKIVHSLGIPLAIIGKETPIESVLKMKPFKGTLIKPSSQPIKGRKKLLTYIEQPKGVLFVDEGAKQAILKGKSLLAVGVKGFEGSFKRGDTVSIALEGKGQIFARGKVNFSSEELKKILGKSTDQIRELFPNRPAEVIHRDNLVVL